MKQKTMDWLTKWLIDNILGNNFGKVYDFILKKVFQKSSKNFLEKVAKYFLEKFTDYFYEKFAKDFTEEFINKNWKYSYQKPTFIFQNFAWRFLQDISKIVS